MRVKDFHFFTYRLPEEMLLKFVLRGIYPELDLSTRRICALRVSHLRVARIHTEVIVNGEHKKRYLPLVLVHLPRSERQKKLEPKTISRIQIQGEETRKSNHVDQCHRCQIFGHPQALHCDPTMR
jgi:hypothetical protein